MISFLTLDSDDEKIDDSVKDSPARRGYLDGSASSFFSPQKNIEYRERWNDFNQ